MNKNSKNNNETALPSESNKTLSRQPRHSRLDVCITKNHLKSFKPTAIPGNNSYASTSTQGKRIFLVGDGPIKYIKRNDFNKELKHRKAFFHSFSGADAKRLYHYIILILVDDRPDAAIIHA